MERGYILHHRPYKEAQALVNLLVDGHGRVDAVARVGSGKRSNKAIIQPFQPLIFNLSGKNALKNLTQVEAAAPAIPLQAESLYSGMYLNELLVRVLSVHHDVHTLFQIYHNTLIELARKFDQIHLRLFEHQLLQELGIMPSLMYDCTGEPLEAEIFYRFFEEEGFRPYLNTRMNNSYSGASLMALRDDAITEQHYKDLKYLMRQILQPLLGNKPLVSRKLFAQKFSK
ncbi:DNA repair protein RecO [Parashewanella curva]|uniref:DNA repair protein RecO n=1 Tax=Parashewanella curva TaxID=2338552 RepID=A0A3L8PS81_9GAMM|nr:DNA repair protein RecO [Parashewanella curva]RLV58270.1 DNA repair protein RecO [Parashewanella curva]